MFFYVSIICKTEVRSNLKEDNVKKKIISMLIVFVLMSVVVTEAFAMSRVDGAFLKVGRGLTNIVTGAMEVFEEIDVAVEDDGIVKGVAFGLPKGIVKTIQRIGAGIYEVISCPIECPSDYQPVLTPEYVFVKE